MRTERGGWKDFHKRKTTVLPRQKRLRRILKQKEKKKWRKDEKKIKLKWNSCSIKNQNTFTITRSSNHVLKITKASQILKNIKKIVCFVSLCNCFIVIKKSKSICNTPKSLVWTGIKETICNSFELGLKSIWNQFTPSLDL